LALSVARIDASDWKKASRQRRWIVGVSRRCLKSAAKKNSNVVARFAFFAVRAYNVFIPRPSGH
jgi:hypothetical protein